MGVINLLEPQVANLIAAGEVVERPASAIKELMENAIDAGAKRVTAEIKNGGVTLMRITDDGCGMTKEDAILCVRRHATSKIRNAADLDGIVTLGFRGEALAAIASVSRLRILTPQPERPSPARRGRSCRSRRPAVPSGRRSSSRISSPTCRRGANS